MNISKKRKFTYEVYLVCLLSTLTILEACGSFENKPKNEDSKFTYNEDKDLENDLDLANSLEAAEKLEAKYASLYQQLIDKSHIAWKPGTTTLDKNTDSNFVGIDGIKEALKNESNGGNLTKFQQWAKKNFWNNYHVEHYDWWMFPIDQSSLNHKMKYVVGKQDIAELKKDKDWLRDYRLGVILLMRSWGWDMKNKCFYTNPSGGQKWTGYQVRLGKAAYSLILFKQWDLYESVKEFVKAVKNREGFEKKDTFVTVSFPDI